MSNRSGTNYSAPTDADRRPVVMGVSSVDGVTPLPLEVNPANGQLLVTSSGGGGGTQYTNGTTVATPTGTLSLGYDGTKVYALPIKNLATQVVTSDNALITNSVIHGLTTGGGGGYVDVKVNPSGALTVDSSGSTVTANIGTTNGLALDATLTGGTQQTKITDGTNVASVVAGDTGYNGVVVNSGTKTISFTTSGTGAQTIGPFNVAGYTTIEVVWTSIGTGLAVTGGQFSPTSGGTYQTSNTFSTGINAPSNPLGVVANTYNKTLVYGNYFQIAVSALTSGTATGYITLRNGVAYNSNTTASVLANNATTLAIPTTALPAGFQARTSEITATTNGYNTQATVDKVGKLVSLPYAVPELFVKGAQNTTGTGSVTLLAAAGAGIKNYVTSISVMNTGATTTVINILDGATTIYTVGAPAGGGATLTLPIPLASTANTAINFNAVNASTTIYVSVAGYTGA